MQVDPSAPLFMAGVLVAVFVIGGVVLLAVARRRTARAQLALRFTPHAADRMAQRGVREDEVRKAVARPSRVVATTYSDRGSSGSPSEQEERDSVRLERDFRSRTLKVWVPTDWRSTSLIAVKSVAWQYTATLRVAPRKVGAIIGRGGQTIRNLEQVYEVRIHVDRSGSVRIIGDDGVATAAARQRIRQLVGH